MWQFMKIHVENSIGKWNTKFPQFSSFFAILNHQVNKYFRKQGIHLKPSRTISFPFSSRRWKKPQNHILSFVLWYFSFIFEVASWGKKRWKKISQEVFIYKKQERKIKWTFLVLLRRRFLFSLPTSD